MVAVGEVGPADRAAEEDVADDGEAGGTVDQGDMARRVARAVQDLEDVVGEAQLLAFREPAVGQDIAGTGDPVGPALLLQTLEEEPVLLGRAHDRDRGLAGLERIPQGCGPAGMVDMAVGEPDRLRPNRELPGRVQDALDVAARVDHDSPHAGLIPQDGAVLLERGHGHDGGSDLWHAHSGSLKLTARLPAVAGLTQLKQTGRRRDMRQKPRQRKLPLS